MQTIIERLSREPVALRAAIAAALNLLAVLGVLDTAVADELELTALAFVNLLLVISARQAVEPAPAVRPEDIELDDAAPDPDDA